MTGWKTWESLVGHRVLVVVDDEHSRASQIFQEFVVRKVSLNGNVEFGPIWTSPDYFVLVEDLGLEE